MVYWFFFAVTTPAPERGLVTLAVAPTPAEFWTVVVWGIVPAAAGIWIVYRQQQARLRRALRRLRQLEARLAMTGFPTSVVSAAMPPTVSRNPRPSPLTTRIVLPAASGKGRSYTQPVPGALS
jgi:hypothetical protein